MATCPAGHESGADDYCDVCGVRMGGASQPSIAVALSGDAGVSTERCPDCGAQRTGRFCEECGYDFVVGAGRPTPPTGVADDGLEAVTGDVRLPDAAPIDAAAATGQAPAGWTAEVIADHDYYARVVAESGEDAATFTFPPYAPRRQVPLSGAQIRIGRRSVTKGTIPEIDLSEPPEDPGVSHMHAVLLSRPDGTWSLVDPGSTNGTTVNGADDPIAVNVEVPLKDGDRVHVGVWTTIILRRT